MTEISFHFNAPTRIGHVCRVVRKAQRQGVATAVTGPADVLAAFDEELWTFAPAEFVAHAWASAAASIPAALHASTIWLSEDAAAAPVHAALVNLGPTPPRGFESYERVIEVVTGDDADRQAARLRWKEYARRGYPIVRHEVSA